MAVTDTAKQKLKKDLKPGALLAMVSGFLFVLIYSSWTSPAFPGAYGYDSAFFSMVGRAIVHGKVMYRDYFDIKGPVFFFWEALGQLVHTDKPGIFFLQCISAVAAAYFLYLLCRLYALKRRETVLLFVAFYLVYGVTLWGGNTVEEFCLPLNLACIWYGLKYLKGISREVGISFFFGIVFAVCFLSKLTVAAPMAGITLAIVLSMVMNRDFSSLIRSVLLFLGGVAVVTVPVFLYYILRGSFDDMFLCAFQIAGNRSVDYYVKIDMDWEKPLLICYVGLLLWLVGYGAASLRKGSARRRGESLALLCMSLMIILGLHFGTPLDYYYITTLPELTLVLLLVISAGHRLMREHRRLPDRDFLRKISFLVIGVCGIVLVLTGYAGRNLDKLKENYDLCFHKGELWNQEECQQLFSLIPEAEQNSVFSVESGMIIFEVNQKFPATRYPVNMPYFCELYPPAQDEIIAALDQKPKWVVTEQLSEVENETIRDYIYLHYEKISETSMNQLWRRKREQNP